MRAIIASLATAVALTGCGATEPPRPVPAVPASIQPSPASTPFQLTADDIRLRVKILDKRCFGSAGCNVEYRVEIVDVAVGIPADASYEVSYEVSGPEDGPEIGTFMITGDQYEVPSGSHTSISSSGVKLKVRITEVVAQ